MNQDVPSGEKRGKYGRLLRNTAIISVGTFASKLLVFFLLPLYTGYLSASEYGTADLIANMANFLIPIFCCNVSEGMLRFTLREKNADYGSREAIFSTSVVITLIGSAVLALCLPIFWLVEGLGTYALLVILYVVAANLHAVAAEYVRACEKTALYSLQGVINTTLVIVLNLILLLGFDAGVTGYVLSIILADFITTVFLVCVDRQYRVFSLKQISARIAKKLIAFSLPLVPAAVLWWVVSVSDRYLLTWLVSGDANGLYVAAAKIPTVLTILCTVFLTAWKVSAVVEDSGIDEEELKRRSAFYGTVYKGFVSVLFCMGAGIVLFSQLLARILFADAYFDAWQYIPVLTLGTVFYSLSRFLGSVYFAERASLRSFLTALAAAAVNVVLNFLLIPHFGAIGAGAATLAAYFSEYIVRDIDVQKHLLQFPPQRLRILVCALILLAETVVITLGFPYAFWIAAVLTALMIFVNARVLLEAARGIFRIVLKRAER